MGSARSDAPRFLLNSFEVKSTMGMIDQRGEWRRVVTDGQRQAQAEGQGQDEQPLSAEEWGTTAVSEQRGIRLLPDSDAVRTPGRVGTTAGRTIADGVDQGHEPDPGASPVEDQGRVERARRLRSDEAHAPRPTEPHGVDGRLRGPLSARMARRQRCDTPGTIAIAIRSSEDDRATSDDDAP